MKIYRDKDGKCINIGDWDYQINPELPEDKRIQNPLPDGAYEDDAEIVEGYDGGQYLTDDPRKNG